VAWLHAELLPHAQAEEAALYPAAAAQPGGRLLVDGMLIEHRAITAVDIELTTAATAPDAAAAARALHTLFAVHMTKENDLVVPLLVAADDVYLAGLLDGLHDLIGAAEAGIPNGGSAAGCGGGSDGGGCGCVGDSGRATAGSDAAAAPVLSLDARIDVRHVPHDQRHAQVLAAVDALPADGALVLIAPHAPRPLLAEIDARYRGQVDTQWLQDGPDVWQVRLHRQRATA
jgi:uncharacterized protein (DUF2249 family)